MIIHVSDKEVFQDFLYNLYADSKRGVMGQRVRLLWDYVLLKIFEGSIEKMSIATYSPNECESLGEYVDIMDKVVSKEISTIDDVIEIMNKKSNNKYADPEKQALLEKIEILDSAISELMLLIPKQ